MKEDWQEAIEQFRKERDTAIDKKAKRDECEHRLRAELYEEKVEKEKLIPHVRKHSLETRNFIDCLQGKARKHK